MKVVDKIAFAACLLTGFLAVIQAGCGTGTGRPLPSERDDDDLGDDDETFGRWSGSAQVRVVDPDGEPVAGAYALLGGAADEDWEVTDDEGLATVRVDDDGITDRWLVADKEGYTAGGVDLDDELGPTGVSEIVIFPLPDLEEDNLAYAFQPGGTGESPDTSECGHCHRTIADDWSTSNHRGSASNPRVWDVYVGGSDLDAEACAVRGGWMAEGQEPGVAGGSRTRCYVGAGVLRFLHEDCGAEGEDGCDHPDHAADLDTFGSCGDCHVPAFEGAQPGAIDFARSMGVAHDEGVTCDLCHKIRGMTPGPSPGRDGAIALQRPSEPTNIFGQEFDPITFGPYPDVPLGIMKGAYSSRFRDEAWCSACHEYARPALHPDQEVDPERWPDGLPILETYSEYLASAYAATPDTCQGCHMIELDEESSTYDITTQGLTPSVDQGWFRALGEVRHHDFARVETEGYGLQMSLAEEDGAVVATVTVRNNHAGHALPTGAPMRQFVVLVEAADAEGDDVPAIGGQALPEDGGWRHRGEVDLDVSVDGPTLTFAGQAIADVQTARFVRPTATWDDYDGPGTGSFDGLAPEDKGLPIHHVIAERAITAIAADTIDLAEPVEDLQPGDLVYLCDLTDLAGAPGWLYGKTFLDAAGTRGVPHYRAIDLAVDNRIAAGDASTTTHHFPVPEAGDLTVTATLMYRRLRASVAAQYGWELEDEELAVQPVVFSAAAE